MIHQHHRQTTCNRKIVLCTIVHRAVKWNLRELSCKKSLPDCRMNSVVDAECQNNVQKSLHLAYRKSQ